MGLSTLVRGRSTAQELHAEIGVVVPALADPPQFAARDSQGEEFRDGGRHLQPEAGAAGGKVADGAFDRRGQTVELDATLFEGAHARFAPSLGRFAAGAGHRRRQEDPVGRPGGALAEGLHLAFEPCLDGGDEFDERGAVVGMQGAGGRDQSGGVAVFGASGDAGAEGDAEGDLSDRHVEAGDVSSEFVDHRCRPLRRRVEHQHTELFAAVTADDVGTSEPGDPFRRQTPQHEVAGLMSPGVVDRLEVIDVDHHQRHVVAGPPTAREFLADSFDEPQMVDEAGQSVALDQGAHYTRAFDAQFDEPPQQVGRRPLGEEVVAPEPSRRQLGVRGISPLPISINVPSNFLQRSRFTSVLPLIERSSVPITIEVSELGAFADPSEARRVTTSGVLRGLRFSLDDFGTLNSNIDRFVQLPFDELKLDRAYVSGCAEDPIRDTVCRAAIELAHTRNATIVAEGVETAADFARMRELGVDRVQGYFFSRPLALPALTDWILSHVTAEDERSSDLRAVNRRRSLPMNEPMRVDDVPNMSYEDRFAELRRRLLERLRRDAEQLSVLRRRFDGGEPLGGELLRDLRRAAHGLAGAASIFGFEVVSEAAHRVETCLRELDGKPVDPSPLFDTLEREIASTFDRVASA